MTTLFKTVSMLSLVTLVTIAAGFEVFGQDQPPAGAPAPARGRGTPPPPPPQAGHPSGKLVIWGDLASFDQPATAPTHCILTNRFKRGQRVGIRMTAIDGGSGEVENTAVARPVSVGYVQFESLINKAFGDIRNGADPAERLTQAQAQIEDAWTQLK